MTAKDYKVSIAGLRIHAIVGVHNYERTTPQPLVMDIQMRCAAAELGDDELDHVVDYSVVAAEAQAFAEAGRFKLIETLAAELADLLLERHPLTEVTLQVAKPRALANAELAAVQVTRTRG